MGLNICRIALADDEVLLTSVFEREGHPDLGSDIGDLTGRGQAGIALLTGRDAFSGADVLIDFTQPDATLENAELCASKGVKMVIGTTGLDPEEEVNIRSCAERTAIVLSPNMAVGVNVLFEIIEQAASFLGKDFSVSIDETHHVHKKDSPSGTAKKMAEILEKSGLGKVPVSSSREGEVVGFHRAVYESDLEKLIISHEAKDRSVFAAGAIKAAKFVAQKDKGLYDMKNVLGIEQER